MEDFFLLGRSEYVFSRFGTINRRSFFLSNFKNTIKNTQFKKNGIKYEKMVFINPNSVNSSEDENEVEEVQQDTSEEEEEVPDPKLGK